MSLACWSAAGSADHLHGLSFVTALIGCPLLGGLLAGSSLWGTIFGLARGYIFDVDVHRLLSYCGFMAFQVLGYWLGLDINNWSRTVLLSSPRFCNCGYDCGSLQAAYLTVPKEQARQVSVLATPVRIFCASSCHRLFRIALPNLTAFLISCGFCWLIRLGQLMSWDGTKSHQPESGKLFPHSGGLDLLGIASGFVGF